MPTTATATISERLARKLAALSKNYSENTGGPFQHFFCPVLYRDEVAELCEAHVVNKAFGASPTTTVQRADVDAFFGSPFESDFLVLKARGKSALEVITDRTLAKQLKAQFEVDGHVVELTRFRRPSRYAAAPAACCRS